MGLNKYSVGCRCCDGIPPPPPPLDPCEDNVAHALRVTINYSYDEFYYFRSAADGWVRLTGMTCWNGTHEMIWPDGIGSWFEDICSLGSIVEYYPFGSTTDRKGVLSWGRRDSAFLFADVLFRSGDIGGTALGTKRCTGGIGGGDCYNFLVDTVCGLEPYRVGDSQFASTTLQQVDITGRLTPGGDTINVGVIYGLFYAVETE